MTIARFFYNNQNQALWKPSNDVGYGNGTERIVSIKRRLAALNL